MKQKPMTPVVITKLYFKSSNIKCATAEMSLHDTTITDLLHCIDMGALKDRKAVINN